MNKTSRKNKNSKKNIKGRSRYNYSRKNKNTKKNVIQHSRKIKNKINKIRGGDTIQFEKYINDLTNNKLVKLDLSNKNLDLNQLLKLANALINNHTLTELNISNNNIGLYYVLEDSISLGKALFNALAYNTSLKSLNISNNYFSGILALSIAEVLKKNQTLTSLDISSNYIESTGAIALANALKKNHTLEYLNIGNNEIRDKGVNALAAALQPGTVFKGKFNTTLRSLILNNKRSGDKFDKSVIQNIIGNGGAKHLAIMLKKNKTLKELDISGNDAISEEGAQALENALGGEKGNSTLTTLNIINDKIKEETEIIKNIKNKLKENKLLENVSGNSVLGEPYTSAGDIYYDPIENSTSQMESVA